MLKTEIEKYFTLSGNESWQLVAEINGDYEYIGEIVIKYNHPIIDCFGVKPDNAISIWCFCIYDGFRRQGYATHLMKKVINNFKGKDIVLFACPSDEDIISMSELLRFYEKLGFEKVDADTEWYAGPEFNITPMMRKADYTKHLYTKK